VADYAIRGGTEGYERLLLLARDRRDDTLRLLRRAGVGPGLHCLDVGCGGGEVSLDLAEMVSPTGVVVGLDLDEIKLDLARKAASERQLTNVTFTRQNLTDWPLRDRYDIVYSRFVLHHMTEPVGLLRRMWAAVAPGGRLVIEDADFDGNFSYPPNPGATTFTRLYIEMLARRGTDATIGRKLYHLFGVAGIPAPQLSLVTPAHATGEVKRLRLLTFRSTADNMVADGLATQDEVDAALASLAGFIDDPTTVIGGPRIFQVWAARPGETS
jgi:ubiquinone/menaquinone biosynthesis C-methylase UbiE